MSLQKLGLTEQFKETVAKPSPQEKKIQKVREAHLASGKGEDTINQNNDYIESVPLGTLTQLNTKEHKFYGFYFRIRQKLEQHWGNSLQQKAEVLWKKGRRMPSSTQRITGVIVKIDEMGQILDVVVKSSSGVLELDQAAVESFNKAGPFPNPPKDMLENGRAEIEWGFVVKT
jgi:TonB family protein